jgi:hypothetical protein
VDPTLDPALSAGRRQAGEAGRESPAALSGRDRSRVRSMTFSSTERNFVSGTRSRDTGRTRAERSSAASRAARSRIDGSVARRFGEIRGGRVTTAIPGSSPRTRSIGTAYRWMSWPPKWS